MEKEDKKLNCPIHRQKIHYEPILSTPNSRDSKRLVYYCSLCSTLYIFQEITVKSTKRGVLIMSVGKLKRAGFYAPEDPDHST